MRRLVHTMFISNNHASFHLWLKEALVKHQKVSKYENGCRERMKPWFFVTFSIIISLNLPENLIEIPQVVQKIWRFSPSIWTIFINVRVTKKLMMPTYSIWCHHFFLPPYSKSVVQHLYKVILTLYQNYINSSWNKNGPQKKLLSKREKLKIQSLLNLKNLDISFFWICSIMKVYLICYVSTQTHIWKESGSWNMSQNALSQSDCRIF